MQRRITSAGYSLVETIIAVAILALALATAVSVMQLSDNIASQTQIDAGALMTFNQSASYVANAQMACFRASLASYMSSNGISSLGTNGVTVNLGTNSGNNATFGMLPEPYTYYLSQVGGFNAFPYTITFTVSSPEGSNAATANYFQIGLQLTYSEPSLLVTTVGATNAPKQLSIVFQKW